MAILLSIHVSCAVCLIQNGSGVIVLWIWYYTLYSKWSNLTLKWAHLPMTHRHATSGLATCNGWLADLHLANSQLTGRLQTCIQVSYFPFWCDISIYWYIKSKADAICWKRTMSFRQHTITKNMQCKVLENKVFLTLWPWPLTYDLDIHTWPWYENLVYCCKV